MVQVERAPQAGRTRSRSPKAARAVLQLLALLARSDHAVRADEAAEAIGRGVSTTYELLDTLCREGFAVHADHGGFELADPGRAAALAGAGPEPPTALFGTVDALFARTGKRSYLAAARSGRVVIGAERGRQGLRRIPGLRRDIGDDAHALALGKIALSLLAPDGLERYMARGLRGFTQGTIQAPDALRDELDGVRRSGVAVDREEFAADVCCVAVPVYDGRRQPVAALAVSMSAHAFDRERRETEAVLREVAASAIPASPEIRGGS